MAAYNTPGRYMQYFTKSMTRTKSYFSKETKMIFLKIITLFSFFMIFIPSGKLIIPVCFIEIVSLIQIPYEKYENITSFINVDFLHPFIILIAFFLFIKKSLKINLIGQILFFIWLILIYKTGDCKNLYYLVTLILHSIISTLFFSYSYFNKD